MIEVGVEFYLLFIILFYFGLDGGVVLCYFEVHLKDQGLHYE